MIEYIKSVRLRFGISQVKFARKLGIHSTTLSRWESGTNRVPALAVIAYKQLEKELDDDTKCS